MQVPFQFDYLKQTPVNEILTDLEKIYTVKETFIEQLTREVNRMESLKWKAHRKSGRRSSSVAKVNLTSLADKFGLSDIGYSELDMLVGTVALNLPMIRKDNYYNDVSSIVEAYLSKNLNGEDSNQGPRTKACPIATSI